MNRIRMAALAVTTTLAMTGAAMAHVTLETAEAPAGSYYKALMRVGHGCDGSPMREMRVKVPDGMVSVKPMPKPGWEVSTVIGKLATPYESHGKTITEGVTEVRWTGGRLLDEHMMNSCSADNCRTGPVRPCMWPSSRSAKRVSRAGLKSRQPVRNPMT